MNEDEDDLDDSYDEEDQEPLYYDYVDSQYDEGYYDDLHPVDIPEKGEWENCDE